MRKIAAFVTGLAMGVIIFACAGGGTPQCHDGAVKVVVNHGKRATYHCHDGSWRKQ